MLAAGLVAMVMGLLIGGFRSSGGFAWGSERWGHLALTLMGLAVVLGFRHAARMPKDWRPEARDWSGVQPLPCAPHERGPFGVDRMARSGHLTRLFEWLRVVAPVVGMSLVLASLVFLVVSPVDSWPRAAVFLGMSGAGARLVIWASEDLDPALDWPREAGLDWYTGLTTAYFEYRGKRLGRSLKVMRLLTWLPLGLMFLGWLLLWALPHV